MPERLNHFRFTPARVTSGGLLGFASYCEGRLIIDRIAVRRSASGSLTLTFPRYRHDAGPRYSVVRPLDQAARDQITAQFVVELRRLGVKL